MKQLIKTSIQRIKDYQTETPYHLAFSGGKDSITVKQLMQIAGVPFEMHHRLTTIDPPELVWYIRRHHPETIIHRPPKPFFEMMQTRGYPTRQNRWCCAALKEHTLENAITVTGIRREESARRKTRPIYEKHWTKVKASFLHPIIDWAADEIWQFIHEQKLPYCELYDRGWHRLGCLFCPSHSVRDRQREANDYPKYHAAFRKAFNQLYQKRKQSGAKSVDVFQTGDEFFEWWLSGKSKDAWRQAQNEELLWKEI